MKRMTLRLVMLLMAALMACAPAMAEVDAFTSASVTDFYGDNALAGDELMNAINSFSGFYLVCTHQPRRKRQRGLLHLWLRGAGRQVLPQDGPG